MKGLLTKYPERKKLEKREGEWKVGDKVYFTHLPQGSVYEILNIGIDEVVLIHSSGRGGRQTISIPGDSYSNMRHIL